MQIHDDRDVFQASPEELQATRQKLALSGTPPMTAEDIDAEIKAYRAERRRAADA